MNPTRTARHINKAEKNPMPRNKSGKKTDRAYWTQGEEELLAKCFIEISENPKIDKYKLKNLKSTQARRTQGRVTEEDLKCFGDDAIPPPSRAPRKSKAQRSTSSSATSGSQKEQLTELMQQQIMLDREAKKEQIEPEQWQDSREDSHRGLHPRISPGNKVQPVAFVVRTNNNNSLRENARTTPHVAFSCLKPKLPTERVPEKARHCTVKDSHRGLHPRISPGNKVQLVAFVVRTNNNNNLNRKDSKYFVGFDEHECYIQDLKHNSLVGTRSETSGLYLFDVDKNGKIDVGMCNSTFVCYVFKNLWHFRLGHPADQVLSVLGNKIGFKNDSHVSPCDIYHRTKHTMEPFPLSDDVYVCVGELVHGDVRGPFKVVSKDDYKYFLTIIDDYSKIV
uniref:Ribonuclease H-like domain-containing protein n=1 Tax=Tanacetum cinerariifolium TaxID=118510 RepID=A0A699H0J6_TANCI|nr:ribonuclease H-like domain-containing protein [Tanacetum cinerariifolium]